MMPRSIAITSLVLALSNPSGATALAQGAATGSASRESQTDRQEGPSRSVERSIVEDPSTRWDTKVRSEVVDETVRRDGGTSQQTRSVFVTDPNGRQRLVSTVQEQRIARPDGGYEIIRDFAEQDVNGRSRTTRREREQMVPDGKGFFVTEIEVTEPSVNGGGFVPTGRIEQRERRVGDQLVERQSTTYSDPTGRGRWDVVEQRALTRQVAAGGADAVESIYRRDSSGNLMQSEQIVSREWTAGGRAFRTEDIYGRDINNGGALTRSPMQQVEIVRTARSDGGSETTRTVSERQGDRLQVIEQGVERARPDGRGGTVIEEEVQRSIVNGRLETVFTGSTQKSQ
jgi:hypothetical protein